MSAQSFWHEVWAERRLGFHQEEVHPVLRAQAPALFADRDRVLVPLCGKTLDLRWLAGLGPEVVGVELVPAAVEELHEEQAIAAERRTLGSFEAWESPGLTVLCGDFFDASPAAIGTFDACWDRAALVALPPAERARYVEVQRALLRPGATVLLQTFAYAQEKMSGPPWSVPPAEVRSLWAGARIETRETQTVSLPQFEARGVEQMEITTWEITT